MVGNVYIKGLDLIFISDYFKAELKLKYLVLSTKKNERNPFPLIPTFE